MADNYLDNHYNDNDYNNNQNKKVLNTTVESFIPKKFQSIISKEDNPQFEMLVYDLAKYKKKLDDSLITKTIIHNKTFKKLMYDTLEELLFESVEFLSGEIRKVKINALYKWFNNTMTYYQTLSSINCRTTLDNDQELDEELIRISNLPDVILEHAEIAKHRENLLAIGQFQEYHVKVLKKPTEKQLDKRFKNKEENKKGTEEVSKDIKYIDKTSLPPPFDPTKSTFYASGLFTKSKIQTSTNFNTCLSNFNQSKSLSNDISPGIEIKSSFSYTKPNFNLSSLRMEHNIKTEKDKQLRNKRSEESIKAILQEFGDQRAKYKQQMIQKHDMKTVVNHYKKQSHDIKTQQSLINIPLGRNRKSICLRKYPTILIDSSSKQLDMQKSISSDKLREKLKRKHLGKITTDDIQNIDNLKKIIQPQTPEVIYEMKLNKREIPVHEEIYHKLQNNSLIPSDGIAIGKNCDPLFNERYSQRNLCNLNEFDFPKTGYDNHGSPMSSYDLSSKITSKPHANRSRNIKNDFDREYYRSGYGFAKKSFYSNSQNYLNLRKTMGNHMTEEIKTLKKKIHFKKSRVNPNALQNAFQKPNDNEIFPPYYLPKSGSGLLVVPAFDKP